MWQFLVAAAVAGSGFLARAMIFRNGDHIEGSASNPSQISHNETVLKEEEEKNVEALKPSLILSGGFAEKSESQSSERENSGFGEEGIFRFSSLCREGGSGFRSVGSKGSRKKIGLSGNADLVSRVVESDQKIKKNNLGSVNAEEMMESKRKKKKKKKGRMFSVCLKRRRTMGKNTFGKCDSCCSQGGSLINWGIGVGLMYMVSARKAEINKLNVAIDETKELINELKQKLNKAKLSIDLQDSSYEHRVNQCAERTVGKNKQLEIIISGAEGENHADNKILGNQISDDCECASSVLTEESDPQLLEIDLLEAELESELQKISCYATEETSGLRGEKSNMAELDQENLVQVKNTQVSDGLQRLHEQISSDCNFFQSNGVSPYELDRKLCHLLIEQQESKIVELQSKLQSTDIKLHEKEAELLSLKNCVRHFRDLSLETNSDGETDGAIELDNDSSRLPSGQRAAVVGMKRAMEFGSCEY